MASHLSINREISVEENYLCCLLKNPYFETLTYSFLVGPPCSLFFHQIEVEKEREEDEEIVTRLSLLVSLEGVLY